VKTITVNQPWASLIVAGIKTVETRPSPPNGAMRPDGVRGLPGLRIEPGDRIAIHAAAHGWSGINNDRAELIRDLGLARWRRMRDLLNGDPEEGCCYPLGAIVGTVVVADALAIGHLPDGFVLGTERYPIPSAPGYEAAFDGTIWSVDSNWRGYGARPMTSRLHDDGYPAVRVRVAGQEVRRTVHSLVAEAWIGPRPASHQVRHMDGNPENSAPWNLRYGTASDNARDAVIHRTKPQGHTHHKSKLSAEDVVDVRSRRAQGETFQSIADRHGVSKKAVMNVVSGKAYGTPAPVDDSEAQGRWGWLLTDPKPTTSLCPCCLNDTRSGAVCKLCNDLWMVDPVPVRGRQGVWEWTP
jgi:hypothetical protein